ncbi:MAG: HAMP domain-containing histidine kinase [Pseudomonadales bacterium]|nr:HAMP domain-containing histidine kinase [Pseudomonadales bacterium]
MKSTLDFSLLLASAVHDMKNSVGMLLSTVEQLDQSELAKDSESKSQLALLHAEAARINNDLVHLLGIYRIDQDQLVLNYQECYVFDLLQDQIINNDILFTASGIDVSIECDESLSWIFDEQLISDVICNVLINAVKYANNKVILRAGAVGDELVVSVLDDGLGYPQKMLSNLESLKEGFNFSAGSTQLGLFFASRIAAEHAKGEARGSMRLENYEGGGMFSILLP